MVRTSEAYPVESVEASRRASSSPARQRRSVNSKQNSTNAGGAIFTFTGFAGTTDGSFFAAPAWVDKAKTPGTTSQDAAYCPSPNWWFTAYSGYSLFFSPNLVWLFIALADYFIFPYDLEAAKEGISLEWVLPRLGANALITFAYTGFWHVSLYWANFGKRPFHPNRVWRWSKVLHNLWYNCLAVIQWTGWEIVLMRAWATGKLPYMDDAETFGTARGLLNFVACCFWVPLWRSWHFYFAHRLLHVKPLYKYVHSLHHRNTDIEPFSGLCMHPIEHLYYFACAGPSLYLFASPFAFMWNGVHLLISPAASHSGYEDHFQSDQFHYLHHKHFECNYGPSDCPLDRWFGTFKDKIADNNGTKQPPAPAVDAKSSLLGLPDASYLLYMLLAVAAPLAILARALTSPSSSAEQAAHSVALLVSCGPVLVALLMLVVSDRKAVIAFPKKALIGPFHKERVQGALGVHLVVGAAMTVMPVYHAVHTALAPTGAAAYCTLYGGC